MREMARGRLKNFFLGISGVGLAGSLLLWGLPAFLKPYHISHELDDYQSNLIERVSEIGFGPSGLMRVYCTHQYGGGTPAAIDTFRQRWHESVEHSRTPWPTDTRKLHYDEWGPSNWNRPDGIHVIEMGTVTCLPYSFLAVIFSLPLIVAGCVRGLRRLHLVMRRSSGPLSRRTGSGQILSDPDSSRA